MAKRKTIDLSDYNVSQLSLGDARRLGRSHVVRRIRYKNEARVFVPVEGYVIRCWARGGITRMLLRPSNHLITRFIVDAESRLIELAHNDGWLDSGEDDLFQSCVRCTSTYGKVLLVQIADESDGNVVLSTYGNGCYVKGEVLAAGLASWNDRGQFGLQFEIPPTSGALAVVKSPITVTQPSFKDDDSDGDITDDESDIAEPDEADVHVIMKDVTARLEERLAQATSYVERLREAVEALRTPGAGLADIGKVSHLIDEDT